MKLQKNTISKKLAYKLDDGFSLIETVIAVTTISIFVVLLLQVFSSVIHSYNKLQENSQINRKIAIFVKRVTNDALKVDLYPKHFIEDYYFGEKEIVFFTGGKRVKYGYNGKKLIIMEETPYNNELDIEQATKEYPIVQDFSINYYTREDFSPQQDEAPYYCKMQFEFENNSKFGLMMRL